MPVNVSSAHSRFTDRRSYAAISRPPSDGPMTRIEIPDDPGAALHARAASEGLTLDAWLRNLAGSGASPRKRRYNLDYLVAQCDLATPLSEEDHAWLNATDVGREAE